MGLTLIAPHGHTHLGARAVRAGRMGDEAHDKTAGFDLNVIALPRNNRELHVRVERTGDFVFQKVDFSVNCHDGF